MGASVGIVHRLGLEFDRGLLAEFTWHSGVAGVALVETLAGVIGEGRAGIFVGLEPGAKPRRVLCELPGQLGEVIVKQPADLLSTLLVAQRPFCSLGPLLRGAEERDDSDPVG